MFQKQENLSMQFTRQVQTGRGLLPIEKGEMLDKQRIFEYGRIHSTEPLHNPHTSFHKKYSEESGSSSLRSL
ncbi:hypothetical protein H8744_12435 [Oscillospiraceae bacterium N12]|jgi:hypothetical protein|uniref:Uncharacterized protein n=1 Tax=Jilunia laotingensis TaxID=2763675 RepID=A0A926F8Y0_9BACT|nr:hypothetical protein [Jilunia laotingensis]MBC8594039.1 hypothetical protein [Jilunia laotingensis]